VAVVVVMTLFQIQSTVNPAITRISLTQTGYRATDELSNAVCKTRNLSKSCWLPRDFSER